MKKISLCYLLSGLSLFALGLFLHPLISWFSPGAPLLELVDGVSFSVAMFGLLNFLLGILGLIFNRSLDQLSKPESFLLATCRRHRPLPYDPSGPVPLLREPILPAPASVPDRRGGRTGRCIPPDPQILPDPRGRYIPQQCDLRVQLRDPVHHPHAGGADLHRPFPVFSLTIP